MGLLGMEMTPLTWTTKVPKAPGWYWTRWKIEGNRSVFAYEVIRVEERWPGAELVNADDPFSFSLNSDCYAKYEWAGPMEPPI